MTQGAQDHKPTAIGVCFEALKPVPGAVSFLIQGNSTQIPSVTKPLLKHKVLQTTVYSLLRHLIPSAISPALAFYLSLSGAIGSALLLARPVLAQQVDPQLRQTFLRDPLSDRVPDPLLPMLAVERELSPLELSALAIDLAQLDQKAQQRLAAGEPDQAFELWRRSLRLRRLLGPFEEFAAIQKIAEVAWQQQRPEDVQLLTLRTRQIWRTIQAALDLPIEPEFGALPIDESAPASLLVSGSPTSNLEVLTALAQTFTTLRDIDSAVAVYEQLIALTAAQPSVPSTQITAQKVSLAKLHLAWFQFAEAADVYLELLKSARDTGDVVSERAYLEQLVYSYQQANALTNAVRAQTDLIGLYQSQGEVEKLPQLLVAIAQNYRTLNLPKTAIEYYRSAYSAAQSFQQFSFSAQVLKDLGGLYRSLALTNEAIGAYSLLIPVERQAYNSYGVMNAYDNIGQLQRRQGNLQAAFQAFEQALVIARNLNLREDYFIEQIGSVTPPPSLGP